MKKKRLEELIDSTGSIISGDATISHDFGSDKTSDQYEKMSRQGASNFYGYRRWWGEDDENKPHSKLADKLQNLFIIFLRKIIKSQNLRTISLMTRLRNPRS